MSQTTEAICISRPHLPILALLSPDTLVSLHFPCVSSSSPLYHHPTCHPPPHRLISQPFPASIAGSSITVLLSHLGLSQVEAACVRDYHTFVWSSVPESTTDGSLIHASVQFQGIREDGKLGGRSQSDRDLEEGGGLRNIKVRHRGQGKISVNK